MLAKIRLRLYPSIIGIVMCLTTLIETPNFNKRYKMLFRENNFHVDPKMMYTLCQLLFFVGGRTGCSFTIQLQHDNNSCKMRHLKSNGKFGDSKSHVSYADISFHFRL